MYKRGAKKPALPSRGRGRPAEAALPTAARPAVKLPQILGELEEACKHIGVRLSYEAIGGELGSGGLCKVKGKWRAIFDKRTTPSERVALLLPILCRFPLDDVPLSEMARELLSRMRPPPPADADVDHRSAAGAE
jgi:hypothetical protein